MNEKQDMNGFVEVYSKRKEKNVLQKVVVEESKIPIPSEFKGNHLTFLPTVGLVLRKDKPMSEEEIKKKKEKRAKELKEKRKIVDAVLDKIKKNKEEIAKAVKERKNPEEFFNKEKELLEELGKVRPKRVKK